MRQCFEHFDEIGEFALSNLGPPNFIRAAGRRLNERPEAITLMKYIPTFISFAFVFAGVATFGLDASKPVFSESDTSSQ